MNILITTALTICVVILSCLVMANNNKKDIDDQDYFTDRLRFELYAICTNAILNTDETSSNIEYYIDVAVDILQNKYIYGNDPEFVKYLENYTEEDLIDILKNTISEYDNSLEYALSLKIDMHSNKTVRLDDYINTLDIPKAPAGTIDISNELYW